MSVKENKELVWHYFTPPPPEAIREIQKAKDPVSAMQESYRAVAEQLFAPDLVLHMPGIEGDRESAIRVNFGLIAAFPDASWGVDKMVAEGDMVVVMGKMTGTNRGPYMGIPATGKKVEMGYIIMYRITGGKFVEAWGYTDELGLMRQLGAIPKQSS
jgi:predicted ester cyclase